MSRLLKINSIAILFIFPAIAEVNASLETNSEAGINSVSVPYTGQGISIGQVEAERPGKFGFDNGFNSNFGTIPKEVFLLDNRVAPTANAQAEIFDLISGPVPIAHATRVAGVIIGRDPLAPGVARDADLYATAGAFPQFPNIPAADSLAISAQFIATINDNGLPSNDSIDDVRAINMSFLIVYEANGFATGNSKFTQFVDWSAAKHDVLYVAAGRNDDLLGFFGQPLDNFNGITVGTSEKVDGVYRKFGSSNTPPLPDPSGRTLIDILAPGQQVEVADAGGTPGTLVNGTSFAAARIRRRTHCSECTKLDRYRSLWPYRPASRSDESGADEFSRQADRQWHGHARGQCHSAREIARHGTYCTQNAQDGPNDWPGG